VIDFKHIIYNLLVESYNNDGNNCFASPCQVLDFDGKFRQGFCFNEDMQPEKKLPEMYAQYIRKAPQLNLENQTSIFIQDLYKFYLRACVELLSKYFDKVWIPFNFIILQLDSVESTHSFTTTLLCLLKEVV
jgi:hypothetical protein